MAGGKNDKNEKSETSHASDDEEAERAPAPQQQSLIQRMTSEAETAAAAQTSQILQCPACSLTFSRIQNRERHFQEQHVETVTQWTCPVGNCTYRTVRYSDLTRHLGSNKHHFAPGDVTRWAEQAYSKKISRSEQQRHREASAIAHAAKKKKNNIRRAQQRERKAQTDDSSSDFGTAPDDRFFNLQPPSGELDSQSTTTSVSPTPSPGSTVPAVQQSPSELSTKPAEQPARPASEASTSSNKSRPTAWAKPQPRTPERGLPDLRSASSSSDTAQGIPPELWEQRHMQDDPYFMMGTEPEYGSRKRDRARNWIATTIRDRREGRQHGPTSYTEGDINDFVTKVYLGTPKLEALQIMDRIVNQRSAENWTRQLDDTPVEPEGPPKPPDEPQITTHVLAPHVQRALERAGQTTGADASATQPTKVASYQPPSTPPPPLETDSDNVSVAPAGPRSGVTTPVTLQENPSVKTKTPRSDVTTQQHPTPGTSSGPSKPRKQAKLSSSVHQRTSLPVHIPLTSTTGRADPRFAAAVPHIDDGHRHGAAAVQLASDTPMDTRESPAFTTTRTTPRYSESASQTDDDTASTRSSLTSVDMNMSARTIFRNVQSSQQPITDFAEQLRQLLKFEQTPEQENTDEQIFNRLHRASQMITHHDNISDHIRGSRNEIYEAHRRLAVEWDKRLQNRCRLAETGSLRHRQEAKASHQLATQATARAKDLEHKLKIAQQELQLTQQLSEVREAKAQTQIADRDDELQKLRTQVAHLEQENRSLRSSSGSELATATDRQKPTVQRGGPSAAPVASTGPQASTPTRPPSILAGVQTVTPDPTDRVQGFLNTARFEIQPRTPTEQDRDHPGPVHMPVPDRSRYPGIRRRATATITSEQLREETASAASQQETPPPPNSAPRE